MNQSQDWLKDISESSNAYDVCLKQLAALFPPSNVPMWLDALGKSYHTNPNVEREVIAANWLTLAKRGDLVVGFDVNHNLVVSAK